MYKLSINEQNYDVKITHFSTKEITAEVNGKEHKVAIKDIIRLGIPAGMVSSSPVASRAAVSSSVSISKSATLAPSGGGGGDTINAPIPGQIKLVLVKVGDTVTSGQKVLILEAMKLENEICSPRAGVVKRALVSEGNTVIQDQVLIELE